MKMMGWTAPALRHRSAITWSSLYATVRGAVRHASYHDRPGYCEASVSGPRDRFRGFVRRKLKRSELLHFFSCLAPCLVGIEAFAAAPHLGRGIIGGGHPGRAGAPDTR